MSDISEPVLEVPSASSEAPLDEATLALVAQLMPVLNEVAKAAVSEAVAATPTPTMRPGTVSGINATTRTASVLVDGDTDAIGAQCLIDLPSFGDRVMVAFWPPSAVFVVGNQSANSVPPGTLAPYAGTITAHAGAVSTSSTTGQPPRGWLWCAGQTVSRSTYAALFAAIGTTHGSGDGSTTFAVPDFRGRVFLGLDNMGGSDAGRLSMSNTLGAAAGTETHTLATTNLPSHDHSLNSHTHGVGSYAAASHSHGAGTYAVSSHNHSISSGGSHSHTVNSHSHSSPGNNYFAEFQAGGNYGDGASGSIAGTSSSTGSTSPGTDSQGSHDHGGTTGSSSPGLSGSSDSTAPSLSGTSAAATGNTGTTGSGTAVNHLPPYMLCHVIIKA